MKRQLQDYKDILDVPRHISDRRPHMSIHDRAAQFAPFAALTGHAEAISETARTADSKIVLGEDAVQEISEKLNYIQSCIKDKPDVTVTYFVPDRRKGYGGRYMTKKSAIKKIDNISQTVVLEDETEVNFDDILEIEIVNI